ncbi:MAG: YeeE/YedE family protein [Actinomycetia bacterium]|nr:YeeE/YedE family protein [Actinomycetes bacterium]MCH9700657.1 YeeE/YedE family protein [Actinomycetes bacterium]MCH9761935.1 YeeE/YedE family protein [Actinomycetes bacterium]
MGPLALLVALVLVFVMGVAIQRGNTCTVVAIDDIVHRQSWDRLLAIVYTWFWVAGGLTLVALATGVRPTPQVVPITVWSVAGGLLLGIGAVINGACTTGSVARIGSGEYAFGLTLIGFYLGCVIAPHLFGRLATTHVRSTPALTSLDYPIPTLLGLGVVTALTVRRLVLGPHESFREFLRNAWDPRTATFIIGLLFVALVQVFGPWAYTELLGDVSRGIGDLAIERIALLVVMLAGAVVAGRSMKGAKLIGPLAPRVIRCFCGGIIMGAGFAVAPGAFDGLTLYGQPLLLPFAWAVMGASYVSILVGVLFLRSKFGARIKALRG